jgi:hypothetical protein
MSAAEIHIDSIVRWHGHCHEWRVIGLNVSLGAHVPQAMLHVCGEAWGKDRTVPIAELYVSPFGPVQPMV